MTSCGAVLYYVPVRLPRKVRGRAGLNKKRIKNKILLDKAKWGDILYLVLRLLVKLGAAKSWLKSWLKNLKKFWNRLERWINRFYIIKRANSRLDEVELRSAKLNEKFLIKSSKTVWQNRNWWYIKKHALLMECKLIEKIFNKIFKNRFDKIEIDDILKTCALEGVQADWKIF